jgi:ABC-type multidrug transport system fused ATPase/permease subunit
MKLQMGSVT